MIEKHEPDFLHDFLLDCLLVKLLFVPTTVVDVLVHGFNFLDVTEDAFQFTLSDFLSVHHQRVQNDKVLLLLDVSFHFQDVSFLQVTF